MPWLNPASKSHYFPMAAAPHLADDTPHLIAVNIKAHFVMKRIESVNVQVQNELGASPFISIYHLQLFINLNYEPKGLKKPLKFYVAKYCIYNRKAVLATMRNCIL